MELKLDIYNIINQAKEQEARARYIDKYGVTLVSKCNITIGKYATTKEASEVAIARTINILVNMGVNPKNAEQVAYIKWPDFFKII